MGISFKLGFLEAKAMRETCGLDSSLCPEEKTNLNVTPCPRRRTRKDVVPGWIPSDLSHPLMSV